MSAAIVRLETVSLLEGDLTEEQVETILDKILSKNPDELVLTHLDLREFDISSVNQEKLERVREIVTLKTGMLDDDYDNYGLLSVSDSGDSDSGGLLDLPLAQFIDIYHIP